MMQQAMQNSGSANDMQMIINAFFNLPIANLAIAFVCFFLGGYLLYSSFYAAIGAAVDNETDTQQFIMPILMPLILAVYVGIFTVIEDPHGTVSTVFSFIPLTSPVVMLMRIPFGVPIWQQILSLGLLIGTFMLTVWFAAKIYRVGILMYGKKPTYKELYKWLKYLNERDFRNFKRTLSIYRKCIGKHHGFPDFGCSLGYCKFAVDLVEKTLKQEYATR
jgi:ABC-2 type transport system permease protein